MNTHKPHITFKTLKDFPPGTMYDILTSAYSFDARNKTIWDQNWKESDQFFYYNPQIAEKYSIVTCVDDVTAGLVV